MQNEEQFLDILEMIANEIKRLADIVYEIRTLNEKLSFLIDYSEKLQEVYGK